MQAEGHLFSLYSGSPPHTNHAAPSHQQPSSNQPLDTNHTTTPQRSLHSRHQPVTTKFSPLLAPTPPATTVQKLSQDYTERLELLQDLRFETATTKIKATPDGEFLIASGIYPPQVKVYELRELSLKFERHLDSEIVDFQVLAHDYSKLAFLCADRSVSLHAKYGKHHTLRIPRMGRDMAYDCWSCDLLCAASSPDLYRINLEQGRFLSSLNSQSPALNVVCRSKLHGLVACGGEDGAVECFDLRMRFSAGRISAVAPAGDGDLEVTALEFDGDGGYLMAVGSSSGKVLIYDLRSSYPLRVKDHMYGSSILDIKWHCTPNSEQPKLITTDNHIVKIWDPDTGEGMTSIEPTAGAINDICVFNDSGLMLLALDSSQIPSYFIPALGPAPKWCSSLENLTEELEESGQTTIYDDYKFLTKDDLERLNLTNLIGSNLLRASMHGFFVDYRLYKKAQTLANPFAYSEYLEQRKKERAEIERASRITLKKKLPKVNRNLAITLLEDEAAENENKDGEDNDRKKKSKKRKGLSSVVLKDERFKDLFSNEDFQIDENSREYLSLHPLASVKQPSALKEHFDPVMEDGDRSLSDSDALSESESSEDERVNDERKKKSRNPRLYEIKDERHADAFSNRVSLAEEDSLPLGERVAARRDDRKSSGLPNDVKWGPGGSREFSFISRSSTKYQEDEMNKDTRREKRRGAESLKRRPGRSGFQGRGRGRGSFGRGRRGRW
ncbi:NUC153 domain-containing protein [Cephalotus follicularis]|uniref:NUC153 domain-containing protein n=1 Tax=Cephalotus follicularis TaxID=3775 RepID=A0A1Q3AMX3_CEPFO|nr:NUC153 domain-containing protein [Cephalotus follicularis]